MSGDINYEMICQSDLAEGLSEEQRRTLATVIETRELADGEILITEGYTDNCLYVLNSGKLEVTRKVAGGGEWITLAILREGDIAGELGFIDGTIHSATLRAVGKAKVFSLSRDALESLIDTHPRLVYEMMRTIIREVHKILMRMNQQYVEMNNYITKQHGRY